MRLRPRIPSTPVIDLSVETDGFLPHGASGGSDGYTDPSHGRSEPKKSRIRSVDLTTKATCTFMKTVVRDLAARFADGRLSTQKLLEADDEQLYEMLIEVRGIGRVSPSLQTLSIIC